MQEKRWWTGVAALTCVVAAGGLVVHLELINSALTRGAAALRQQAATRQQELQRVQAEVARTLLRMQRRMRFIEEGVGMPPTRPGDAEIESDIERALAQGFGAKTSGRPWVTQAGNAESPARRRRELTVVATFATVSDVLDDLQWMRIAPRIEDLEIRSIATGLSGLVSARLRLSYEPQDRTESSPEISDESASSKSATEVAPGGK